MHLPMRRDECVRQIRHTRPAMPMNDQIEAVDPAVDTRAGHFACRVHVERREPARASFRIGGTCTLEPDPER